MNYTHILISFAVSAFITLVSAQPTISYEVKGSMSDFNNSLEATINGVTTVIEDTGVCIMIDKVMDFDNDGYLDALVTDVSACGGNAIGNQRFFVSYDGTRFRRSQTFGYSWEGAKVERWEGMLTVYTSVFDEYQPRGYIEKQRHILQDGEAVKVWEYTSTPLPTLGEVRMDDFDDFSPSEENPILSEQKRSFSYDLDNDGIEDVVVCQHGTLPHYQILSCDAYLANQQASIPVCERIGVLETTTNGVHDLVCGDETKLIWQGEDYRFSE